MKWDEFKKGRNMVFAGGCPRSGTTLLQRVVGAHPTVFSDQEFQFLPSHVLDLREVMADSIRAGNIDRIVDQDTLNDALRNFVATIFFKKLCDTGKSVFCEKTPSNALVLPELLKLFPEARFILILRDPRDIVNSFKGVRQRYLSKSIRPPRFVRSVAASVAEINAYFEHGIAAARSDSRILIVHYEDLVNEPDATVRRICDHTGLTFKPEMLELDNRGANVPARKNELWYSKAALSSGIRKDGVITKDRLLSDMEERLVTLYTHDGPELARYGLQQRAPDMTERLAWRLSKLGRHGAFMPRRRA